MKNIRNILVTIMLIVIISPVPSCACEDLVFRNGDEFFSNYYIYSFTKYLAIKRLEEEREMLHRQSIHEQTMAIIKAKKEEEKRKAEEKKYEYIGNFTAYAYCSCASCCGTANNRTASGTYPQAYHTVAVDPAIIPLGTEIKVELQDGAILHLVAEDTGGPNIKGNALDVYIGDHSAAYDFGVKSVKVYIKQS